MSIHSGGRGPGHVCRSPIVGQATSITLSSPTASATSATAASLGVTTNIGVGTLYWVLSTSATPPSKSQIIAAQDSTGAAAAASGNQNVSVTGAQSATAGGLAPTTTYYAYFLQVSGATQSNVASASSFTTSNFATPTLSEDSTAGVAPLTLGLSTTDYVAGLRYELQVSNVLNDTVFASGNITQHLVGFIDGVTWATLDQSAGLITPSGAFSARARILRDDENGSTSVTDQNNVTATYDVSSWSNVVSDTIGGSVATLTTGSGSTGSGTNRSQYLNVTSYEAVMNTGNVGAICADRATIAAQNNKFHCEFTAKFFAATGGNSKFWCGFDDGTISYASFVSATSAAGTSGKNGLTIQVAKGATPSISINGSAFANLTGFATPTDGDVWAFDIDYSGTNPTVLITQYNGTAHVLNGGAITMTAGKPTSWYAFCGGGSGNGTAASGSSDVADFNPSSSHAAFSVTPQTGFNQYG